MNLRSISALAVITALGACGGSSDGSAVNPVRPPVPAPVAAPEPVPVPTVLKTFDDGSGVLRSSVAFTDTSVGCLPCDDIANALTNDVIAKVNGIYLNGVSIVTTGGPGIAPGDISYPSGLSTNPEDVQVSLETLDINGVSVSAMVIYDGYSPAYVIQSPNELELIAGGRKVSNVPLSGLFQYRGSNVVVYRDGRPAEYGTFTMDVDFGAGTGNIAPAQMTTANTSLSGSLIVNNQNGTFSGGNDLTLTTGILSEPASMQGNFHGDAAVGVSGLYQNNGSPSPVVTGAIAGSRVAPP